MNDLSQTTQFKTLIQPLLADVDQATRAHLTNDRLLIPLIAMVVQGQTNLIQAQTRSAFEAGIKPEKILEVIYQLSPIIGITKVLAAVEQINLTFEQLKRVVQEPIAQESDHFGAEVQAKLYGTEIKQLLKDLPDNAGQFISEMLTQHFFNDFYRRSELSVKERERFELLALITLNVDFQIKAHARGSLKAGNTEAELIWSIVQLLPYIGFPLVINSVQLVHQAGQALASEAK